MSESGRPIYLGIGECDCGRIDERLYHPPDSPPNARPLCVACLTRKGFTVPPPRTAEDLSFDASGQPHWKDNANTPNPSLYADKLELGHRHTFETVLGADDRLVGWLHTHPDLRNPHMLCQSFCAVRPLNGSPVHQVLSVEPLSLTPSLRCCMCGAHGHVTNGRWEPC